MKFPLDLLGSTFSQEKILDFGISVKRFNATFFIKKG
jgi:hypothetical protein